MGSLGFKKIQAMLPPDIASLSEVSNNHKNTIITAAMVSKTQQVLTKKGDLMLFATLEDMTGQLEVIVFPSTYKKESAIWVENQTLIVRGKMNSRNGEEKLIIDQSKIIEDESSFDNELGDMPPAGYATKQSASIDPNSMVSILVPASANSRGMQALKEIFNKNPGTHPVHLEIKNNGSSKKIMTKFQISYNHSIKELIEEITGKDSISINGL